MNKRMLALLSVLLVAAFVLSACGSAATPAPTSAPATQAPAPATQAPAPATVAPVDLTIWHGYHAGGSEEATINKIASFLQIAEILQSVCEAALIGGAFTGAVH